MAFCARSFWKSFPEALVLVLYAGNLLQWGFTPCKSTFYYYYYPAAMFLGVAIPLALRQLPERVLGIRPAFILVVAAAVIFVVCYPREWPIWMRHGIALSGVGRDSGPVERTAEVSALLHA